MSPPSLPATTHVGRVHLQVADLERSLTYYQHVLGLRVLERADRTAALGTSDGALVMLRERPGARPVPRSGRLGLYHFAILLPDRAHLGALLAHLTQVGIHPGMADHLVSEALYLRDPDVLGIEVYADRPRATWRHERNEIAMASDPLDVSNLLAAAAAPWDGAPAGTTMGHVHLHVADIAEASKFYHDTIGLDITVRSYPGALFLSAGGYHHHLGVNTWAAGAPPAGEQDARLLEWELVLPSPEDANQVGARVNEAGYSVEEADQAQPLARDPWGTAVRLVVGE